MILDERSTRREVLLGSGAVASLLALGNGVGIAAGNHRVPVAGWEAVRKLRVRERYLGLSELDQSIDRLAKKYPSEAKLNVVGHDRTGHPITMLSIAGPGPSILVIGGSHGNEPISWQSAEALARLLLSDRAVRNQIGGAWHIITSIDPDATRRNEGWLAGPRNISDYLDHVFRPALSDQAEYSFPLDAKGFRDRLSTAENLAWQSAIAATRPDLQISIHGAEFGGQFAFLSRRSPKHEQALLRARNAVNLPVNLVGEPLLGTETIGPGLFLHPRILQMVTTDAGKALWPAGGSSVDATAKAGTLTLTSETAMWSSSSFQDAAPSGITMSDVLQLFIGWIVELETLIGDRHRAYAEADPRLALSVGEDLSRFPGQRMLLSGMMDKLSSAKLSVGEATLNLVSLRIVLLRSLAMFEQLAERSSVSGAATARQAARDYRRQALATPLLRKQLIAVPTVAAVKAQVLAALAAATVS